MPHDIADMASGAPDRAALERQGAAIRARLERNPDAQRVPIEGADIYTIDDFLSAAECAGLRDMVDRVAQPSSTFDQARESTYRTSYSGDFDRWDPFVQVIEARLDDLLGIEPSCGETIQGQRYGPGQEFVGHYDWFDPQARYWPAEIPRGGQRSWTAMMYLNDVEAGGATQFPRLGVSVTPLRGFLLCWNNARPDGLPNDLTLHAAHPVDRGVKYVITKWYRTRAWA